jgi:hypothetical protein
MNSNLNLTDFVHFVLIKALRLVLAGVYSEV